MKEKLRTYLESWKPLAMAAMAVLSITWLAVTKADQVLRVTEEVPAIKQEQAQIRQALNELVLQQRLTQQQVEMLSSTIEGDNARIMDRLDKIAESMN